MGRHPPNRYSLVADIGGTNTRVALAEGMDLLAGSIRKYSNAEFQSLESVLQNYIKDEDGVDCTAACVAVAGPVHDGIAALTNLDWVIDEKTLVGATKAEKVAILNDLQAQGHALGHIKSDRIFGVLEGAAHKPRGVKLVIGVGTGFNAAPVYETGNTRLVPPSECGHAGLPIRTASDLRLAQYLEASHGFPAVEDVLSGRGLERVYRWLGHEAGEEKELQAAGIMQAVANKTDPRADAAVRIFVQLLGTTAGNLSLIHLPYGGVYLVGGVARAMAPYLATYGFQDAFLEKGRFSDLMQDFAVSVIEDDFAALTGCACYLTALP